MAMRELLAQLNQAGIVATTGLIAHGRGEAFDYLLGEKTHPAALLAEEAAAAHLLSAKNPVISVNGNVAALCPREVVELARAVPAKIEVNLFHRTPERVEKVLRHMMAAGARRPLGRKPDAMLEGIASDRAACTREGIFTADVVLVPLEDGDRAEALVKARKVVLAIDLNPLSRTARAASVTIVDEVTRAIPNITSHVEELRRDEGLRKAVLSGFDNKANLSRMIDAICEHLQSQARQSKE